MVGAEMERLRLEYMSEKKGAAAAEEEAKDVPVADHQPPIQSSSHRNNRRSLTSLLGRDEEEEAAIRRETAREYGALLRIQMEQDRLAKVNGREQEGTCTKNGGGNSLMSGSISTTREITCSSTDVSYGELLRAQMKEDRDRRRKQREDNWSTLEAEAAGGINAIGKFDDSAAASKQMKALEYRRQLDEQVAAKAAAARHRTPRNSRPDIETKTTKVDQPIDNANGFAQQLHVQKPMDIIARRNHGRDSIRALESSSTSSSLLSPWHLGEDREAQERQQRRDAALEQQRILELQIKEQNEAKSRRKEKVEEEDAEAADSYWTTKTTNEETAEPAVAPERPPRTVLNLRHSASYEIGSDECRLLAAESTFIPASNPIVRQHPNNSTAFCPMKKDKGGEAFTIALDDVVGEDKNGMGPIKSTNTSGAPAAAATKKKKTKPSICRRSKTKRNAEAQLSSLHLLEPEMAPPEGCQGGAADEDDIIVQDILRSALQRIEDNSASNDGGSHRIGTRQPQQQKKPSASLSSSSAHPTGGVSENVDPRKETISMDNRASCSNDDPDEFHDYDEEAEEEKLRQALSRIRNTMDTNSTGP